MINIINKSLSQIAMPYSKEHKEESRQRILKSAYKLFSIKGYDNVSIHEIMTDAKMTHGGFYLHFKNKSVLYHESIRYAVETSEITRHKPDDIDGKSWIRMLLKKYIYQNNAFNFCPCPLASLATDVVTRETEVRRAYTSSFKGLNKLVANYNESFSSSSKDTVLASTVMIIGAVIIARALDDVELSERVLENCHKEALRLLDSV